VPFLQVCGFLWLYAITVWWNILYSFMNLFIHWLIQVSPKFVCFNIFSRLRATCAMSGLLSQLFFYESSHRHSACAVNSVRDASTFNLVSQNVRTYATLLSVPCLLVDSAYTSAIMRLVHIQYPASRMLLIIRAPGVRPPQGKLWILVYDSQWFCRLPSCQYGLDPFS